VQEIPLKALFIEDSEDDVVLLLRELQRGGFRTDYLRVDSAESLRTALVEEDWDVAISDFHMPGFSGKEALDIVRASGLDAPFVLVSGTVGEEVAVGAVKAGAQDFVSKNKPERLCRVIKRELETLQKERQRLRALAALRESEKRHRELMEHAFGLVFEIDCDGRVHSCNTAFLDTFGLQYTGDLEIQAFAPQLTSSVRKVLDGGYVAQVEFSTRGVDKSTAYLEGNMIPRMDGKDVVGARCFFRDVSERRRYHSQLELQTQETMRSNNRLRQEIRRREETEAQLRLSHKLEAVGQLAAGIAHEINTPVQYISDNTSYLKLSFERLMTVLIDFQNLLKSVKAGSPDHRTLEKLECAVESDVIESLADEVPSAIDESLIGLQRLSSIVRSMSEFAHPGIEGKSDVDINRLVEDSLTLSQSEWKYVATVEKDLAANLPLVRCNRDDIGQTILNMIINAAHAVGDSLEGGASKVGTIKLSTAAMDGCVEIRIEDNGVGIDSELQSRIFDPFFTTKEVGRGTGQGLALAYSYVVRKHRGSIALESKPGQGATFVVRLPIEPDSEHDSAVDDGSEQDRV